MKQTRWRECLSLLLSFVLTFGMMCYTSGKIRGRRLWELQDLRSSPGLVNYTTCNLGHDTPPEVLEEKFDVFRSR